MLFMSCIPALGKAGAPPLSRNPGVLGSLLVSVKFKVQLKENGYLGILQAAAYRASRVFSQETSMNQSSFRGASLLRFTGAGLVVAAAACLAITTRGGAAGGQGDSQVKLTATAGKIDTDGRQTITIKMHVNDDWHAYANPVKNEDLEPNQTVVKVTTAKKLQDVSVVYPPGHRQMSGKESYQVYEGNVEILATVKRAAGDTGPLQVTVQYVTCNDKKGLCLPPESVKLEVK